MAVQWKIIGIFKADAQKVYDEINSIGKSYTPQEIVNKARQEDTELHSLFEWDDSIAAEKYRLTQAQMIVRSLVVKREDPEDQKVREVRVIVSQNANNNRYEPVTISVKNSDSYTRLLDKAYEELRAFTKKYGNLKELEAVIEEIENILATV